MSSYTIPTVESNHRQIP